MANNARFPDCRAVVFDLDGTLIDSAGDITVAMNRVLAAHGRRPLTAVEIRGMLGDGARDLVRRVFAATGSAPSAAETPVLLEQYLDSYAQVPAEPSCLYPGAIETLDRLAAAGLTLALCTNKAERITRLVLDQLGLGGRFQVVLGGDALPQRKPDPRVLGWVVERLELPAAAMVMVGDGINDVLSARALNMPAVAVSYGYPRMPVAELGADVVIDALPELVPLVAAEG